MKKIILDNQKINELLTRGVEEIITKESLERKLMSGKKLRIKYGVDPTAPDIHLGHSICLRKLRQFQNLGHQTIFLIGDFTAQIGDPSGRSETRKPLTKVEIEQNVKTYLKQVGKILNLKKVEVRYNSEWYNKMKLADLMFLYSKCTVARILERDDFKKRLKEDRDISSLEFTYPVLQAYDSVVLKADVEMGGTDQKFNMLMGRKIQKRYGQKEQDVLTVPILEGIDGIKKMSKSYQNYIGITEPSKTMYAKIMSIPDDLILKYFNLLTDISIDEIEKVRKQLMFPGLTYWVNPRDLKAKLAREVVKIYHSEKESLGAEKEFNRIFKEKEIPSEIETFKINEQKINILDLLVKTKMVKSKGEARRLVEQEGVKIDGQVMGDWQEIVSIKGGMIVQVGKRRFIKLNS